MMSSPEGDSLRFAAIEAGGTKFNVGIGGADGRIFEHAQFPTRTPADTAADVTGWLDAAVSRAGPIAAIGIATFGPIDTDPRSATWGRIGTTPKLAWRGADILVPYRRYGVPLALDTDVNGAALAEWRWGAGQGCTRLCYVTVGTGIGGGAVLDGRMLSGVSHPEMGHMFVRRDAEDAFAGACPSHGDCLEGLASGTAIAARWGASLSALGPDHPANAMVADYLAQACVSIVATLAPERIILGGGVMTTPGLIARVRDAFERVANGYFSGFVGSDIVMAELFPLSGLIGGLAIAQTAAG